MSDDEDTLKTAFAIENGKVIVFWPDQEDAPVLRLDPDTADQFADAIKEKAQEARNLTK